MRTVGSIVPVYELCHLAWVYDRMELEKADKGQDIVSRLKRGAMT